MASRHDFSLRSWLDRWLMVAQSRDVRVLHAKAFHSRPMKHTIEERADQLNDEDDDERYPGPRDERMLMGYHSNEIEMFCRIRRLLMYALDIHDNTKCLETKTVSEAFGSFTVFADLSVQCQNGAR